MKRYSLNEIESIARSNSQPFGLPAPESSKFLKAIKSNRLMKERWEGSRTGLKDPSDSAMDMSMGSMLRKAGFNRQEMESLLLYWDKSNASGRAQGRRYFDRIWEAAGKSQDITYFDDENPVIFISDSPIGFDETFSAQPPAPRVLLPGIIPNEVFGLVAPGGTSKTTFMLWLMIHVILDRTVFGRKFNNTGACLFISAEDEISTIRYRVRMLCDAMGLSKAETKLVASSLYVEDVTGKIVRFIEADRSGNLIFTDIPEQIIDVYKDKNIQLVAIDPAMFFSPGERYINDAESSLMQAARRISRGLGGAAVGYIHHTGKSVAREKIIDQYAGRGGSAFADNARALLVLTYHDSKNKEFIPPPEIDDADIESGSVLRLHVAKFSYGACEQAPFWLVRDRDAPWLFHHYQGLNTTSEAARIAAEFRQQVEKDKLNQLVIEYISQQRKAGHYPNKSTVRKESKIFIAGNKVGKDRITLAIDELIETGHLTMQELPLSLKRGNRQTFLEPTSLTCNSKVLEH